MKAKKFVPLDIPTPRGDEASKAGRGAREGGPHDDAAPSPAPPQVFKVMGDDPTDKLTLGGGEQPRPAAGFKLPALPDDQTPSAEKDGGEADLGEHEAAPRRWPVYAGAAVVSALWSLAPIMFAWGYRRDVVPFHNDGFAMVVFSLMALGPMGLVWIAAYGLNQALGLAAEMRRARALGDKMIAPALLAAADVGGVVDAIGAEIDRATLAASKARGELSALRQAIGGESQRLIAATEGSSVAARTLTAGLSGEREKMNLMAGVLEAQTSQAVQAFDRHARMVAEASDLAQAQVREAEAVLASRAADLAATAGAAGDMARLASEDLDRQVARLETAGLGVGDQVRTVEDGLTHQRAALVAAAHGMRADHEAFAAEAETQVARLNEVILHARTGAGVLSESAAENAEALQGLINASAERLRELTESVARERDLLSAAAVQSMGAVSQVALNERQALEDQTREVVNRLASSAEEALRAAERQAEIARHKVDQLAEAAFAAGQKADVVFEARLNDARALIEQSTQLISEAGERSARRFGEGADAARTTLSELEDLLAKVDARVAQLPTEAQARAETVRQTIERGMEDLMSSARRAAEETQTIDAAFQERVRRNYDMLSEAVRLMGVVAGASGGARPPAPRAAPVERMVSSGLRGDDGATAQPPVAVSPIVEPARWTDPPAAAVEPRPRLRLTPTASDEEFKTVFEAAGGREPVEPADESWTWKELLSAMDDAPADDGSVGRALLNEIETMGIDAGALLPRGRIDEIATAFRDNDPEAGLTVVRRLAPAAVRRLARRMMSDRAFRTQADRFTARYQDLIAETLAGAGGLAVSGLLASDQGRVFLLIHAAAGDVG